MPMPPLTHKVATPRFVLRLSISCSSVTVMRVPVHPMGCPRAIDPPFTLSLSRLKFNSRSQAITCAAKASFSSISPTSYNFRLCFSSSSRSPGLRHQRILILLIACDFVLLGQHLGGFAHHHPRQGAEESVAIHAVDQFLVAEAVSPASAVKVIRKARHRFGAAGENAVGIAEQNRLICQRD